MPKKIIDGIGLFANPLAQKAADFLYSQVKQNKIVKSAEIRNILGMVIERMHDDKALLKLMKDFGGKPTLVNVVKTGIKAISKRKKKKPNLKVVKKHGGVIGSGAALRGFGSTRKSNKGVK